MQGGPVENRSSKTLLFIGNAAEYPTQLEDTDEMVQSH